MGTTDVDQTTGGQTLLPLPAPALRALETLETAGYESWIVGGYVRDALLGRSSNDVDIATQAPWPDIERVFQSAGYRVHETGAAHGTLTVVVDDVAMEVTTFRSDGIYEDARHPKTVTFVRSIEEDLARRDFTMNACAYHPERGLLDPYGGKDDLRSQTIRTVGDPAQRFSEDALRILRACRFAAQLGFSIESATFAGMISNKGLLTLISVERITHEIENMLLGPFIGTTLVDTVDVLAAALPELVAMKGFDQCTPYHIYDVLEHTAHAIASTPSYPLVRWAALFHDMGKPASFFTDSRGIGHFYGHARISVELARCIMRRLSFSSTLSSRILTLVERHDDPIEPTPKVVKRTLAHMGGNVDLFIALCDLKRGDALAQAPACADRAQRADELKRILSDILAADEAFSLDKLAINGRDVMALFGMSPGPEIGRMLSAALDAVIDGRIENSPEAIREFLVEQFSGNS